MSLPSGSKLPLAMVCAGSAIYPRTERLNVAADEGNGVHDFMRALASMSPAAALARVADEKLRERCEAINLSGLPVGAGWKAEAAYAYNVETEAVRFLGFDIGRTYGPRQSPAEMFLSIDTSAVVDGVAFAGDWKSGRSYIEPAFSNWQLRVAVLVVCREAGVQAGRGAIIRLREGGEPYLDFADFDETDLAMFAAELRELYRRLEDPKKVVPVMGDHCKYCPCFEACPAQGRLIAKLATAPEEVAADAIADLTPETAWRAYERLKAVEAVTKRVREALYAYASQAPIPLGDGLVFGMQETEREELDALTVRAVIATLHGPEVAEKACDFDTSKAAIERALRVVVEARKKAGTKTTLKALKDEAFQAIREAGGSAVKVRKEVREHRRAAALPEPQPELEVANG
jgi:hypothetical protein